MSFRRKNIPVAPAAIAPGPVSQVSQDSGDAAAAPPLASAPGDVGVAKPTPVGLKPSVYNSFGLVSSGHSQLDELLGGGLQLGTAMLIGSDLHSNYGDSLLSYGLAEALSMRQPCLLLTPDLRAQQELLASLPFNRTLGSVAAGSKSHFCCSYDLSRQLQPEILRWDGLVCAGEDLARRASGASDPADALAAVLDAYVGTVVAFVRTHSGSGAAAAGRVFLYNLHDILYAHGHGLSAAAVRCAMQKFVVRLRVAVRSSRVALVISALPEALPGGAGVATSLSSNSTDGGSTTMGPLQPLIALVDTAFTIDTFAGRSALVPYEFREFSGFLVMERVHHLGTLVGHRPIALRFGLKRDRRKLHVERLHLPPEESRAQGSAGTDARLEERSRGQGRGSGSSGGGGSGGDHAIVSDSTVGLGSGAYTGMSDIGAVLSAAASAAHTSVPVLASSELSGSSTSKPTPTPAYAYAGHVQAAQHAGAESDAVGGRQYKRLNLGQPRAAGAVGGGINISTFRKTVGAGAGAGAGAAGPAGSACSVAPGKDSMLEF